jgi:hypothetical protein
MLVDSMYRAATDEKSRGYLMLNYDSLKFIVRQRFSLFGLLKMAENQM